MDTGPGTNPLIVVVGQTAAGKSALALQLAERHNGAIICADSRTVYRGMDIGTAKPTPSDQARVPHYVLDVVEPDQRFSAADFKRMAQAAMATIRATGKIPIMVGGSGLYIDSVLFDFDFRPAPHPAQRLALESLSVDELQFKLQEADIPLPANARNPRHLIRALETRGLVAKQRPLRRHTLIVGLQLPDVVLRERIARRIEDMVSQGLVKEIERLQKAYGWEVPGLQSTGYRAFRPYLEGAISLQAAKSSFVQNDWQLARRQRTWFKRNKHIIWCDSPEQAFSTEQTWLAKYNR